MNCLCRSAKIICVRIILLDETDFLHEIKDDLLAQALLDVVFSRLNLVETSFFGLRYLDQDGQTHWLDPNARIARQLKGIREPFELYFGVKFYAADPCKLVEEITRYQLYLQVKQDILHGRLPVSFDLAAELAAYVVQSELGDYDTRKHVYGYVSEFRFVANQTRELENRITELHQQVRGMAPSQCELNYLDKVKWHDMYGVDLHPVLGEDSVEYFLGLTPSGIIVLRNKTTVAHYFWPRIAKVYFKGRYFMLRVCDKNNEVSTYGFETPKKSACKHLWRCCVEHHAFFRTHRVAPPQANGDIFTIGSRFRSSAKSEKSSKSHHRAQPNFTRVPSRRQPRRTFDEYSEEKRQENARRAMEVKSVSIPQPVQTYDAPYRSTTSIPATIPSSAKQSKTPDSPRSTRSVPWMRSHQRGLFGINSSPKSVRSATSRVSQPNTRQRSSSVESHSSNESRSGRKSKRRNRRISDNESEFSGRSGRSQHSHRKHRRHRSRSRRSGSENESTHRSGSRKRSNSNHSNHSSQSHRASSNGSLELVDSGDQWLEAQRKQSGHNGVIHQAAVVKSASATKKATSTMSSNTDSHHRRKHRKHKSPSENRPKMWSSELARHLQFDLVDTEGMTEDQLREIPYTVVETHKTPKKPIASSLKVSKTTSKVNNGVDRIRNYPNEQNAKNINNNSTVNGSIRSESTISSSKDFDRNSGLIRMMSSLSMGDFISPSGSIMSPLDSNGLRVSHEHTDSGLGADQDYAYSSERSSDSAKYGTNKSSGASVTSMTHSKSSHMSSLKNHHSVSSSSTSKPPMCPASGRSTSGAGTTGKLPAVHSSATANNNNNNNCLHNNSIFHNNHYTFSLNRHTGMRGAQAHAVGSFYGGGTPAFSTDYLVDTLPYIYTGTAQVSRGTKSDIGVPTTHRRHHHHHHQQHRPRFTSSHTTPNIQEYQTPPPSLEDTRNNNNATATTATTTTTTPFTIDRAGADYLEHYNKTASMQLYNRPINLSSSNSRKRHCNNNNNETIMTSTTAGPLVYVDKSARVHQDTNNYAVPINSITCGTAKKVKDRTRYNFDNTANNRSSSLELILTPIIQSSRRAQ